MISGTPHPEWRHAGVVSLRAQGDRRDGAAAVAQYGLSWFDEAGRGPYTANCDFVGLSALTWVQGIDPRRGPVPAGLAKPGAFAEITPVTITGRGLSGVTRVEFAGRRAVFEVESDRRITAIPLLGATTGSITLTTSDGRIRNAGIYRVFFSG